ncbi:sugar ABC transporter ATP-binding protein [Phyllobacterium sp. 0TCS1.6C]|uniref:sugar ABC transporter ATP-binding protein n=1 Tax=unclassified Phyllobacterium TaxID=2638441 RepID=UPI002264EF0E|nr:MULTISPECIES: sugar ABC transporter ATP-binding protein [unclassified Phyllobacterium]MCX8279854.1 sugar ABC transporter ATP-binding protein [Phyllobacterium sp. 0TCS1.6C]MCX8295542.1 sugar ABC transporter ATP-binding protein [Phyllobacterium sp. 0TCS1.6A]
MSPLLSMTHIDKRFAGIPALSGATFEVAPGEVHALIGQNGAGKSTLIKVLTGYHKRDAGEIVFDGAPFEATSPHHAQASGISTIYQEINLVPYRSVTENICLGREARRFGLLDWKRMHAEAGSLLERFNLDLDVRRPLMEFNTATQQLVAIARAIGFSAKLVIMDEPTSSLDEREVAVLFEVIRQLKQDGVSVVFVSHKIDELYAVCDRVTIMRDGRTVKTAAMREIDRIDLVSSMLGRSIEKNAGHATAFTSRDPKKIGAELLSARNMAVDQSVQDVSFDIRSGEIAGFAGLLGAGRTETARLVFGVDRPRNGAMKFEGQDYSPRNPGEAIAAGMGFCTEDRKSEGIVPEMSVAENMMLALMPKLNKSGIIDEKAQRAIVERFIAQLGIKCSGPNQKICELSGGNQQKVLLARWLAMNPRLLILDEPTRGIDIGAKGEIQTLIKSLADQGLAVLMISSELEEVIEGADRVFVLRDGKSVAELQREAATEDAVMAAMAEGAGPAQEEARVEQ